MCVWVEKQINQYCYRATSDKSSGIACFNLQLWSLDSKEMRDISKHLKTSVPCIRKLLWILWTRKVTNVGLSGWPIYYSVIANYWTIHIETCKLCYLGHVQLYMYWDTIVYRRVCDDRLVQGIGTCGRAIISWVYLRASRISSLRHAL